MSEIVSEILSEILSCKLKTIYPSLQTRDSRGVNTSNTVVAEYSFDAWGRRRNATNWTYTLDANDKALFADRGFTGHEYLNYFNLYNMNGRMYDPLVGRFLSADPIIGDGGYTQSYNRYSYCLNNPLKFTDPSGYNVSKIIHPEVVFSGTDYMSYTSYSGSGGVGVGGGFWSKGDYYTPNDYGGYSGNRFGFSLNEPRNAINSSSSSGKTIRNVIFSGTRANPYQNILGFYYTDGSSYYYSDGPENGGITNRPQIQGGDYSWAKNTQTGMGAFDIGNSVKVGMIDYAVASSAGKSMNSLKRVDYLATLGKTGANYVRAFKVAGVVTFVASTGISAGLMYNYYNSGGTGSDVAVKSGIDVTMGVVGLFWPIGTGISATYFILDAATGGFGGYGDPFKINK
jgi:RHS repeat-associated protein